MITALLVWNLLLLSLGLDSSDEYQWYAPSSSSVAIRQTLLFLNWVESKEQVIIYLFKSHESRSWKQKPKTVQEFSLSLLCQIKRLTWRMIWYDVRDCCYSKPKPPRPPRRDDKGFELLLLGADGSGKSTFIRQMQVGWIKH